MPKPTKGPRLGGSSSHQKALLANLATSLFEHGRIKTTEPKARALRPYAEKLITHAKKGTLHNRREVMKKIRDKDVVHTLFAEIAPFFADRNGGYTRIIKVEARKGDNAPMAVIELVREKTVTSEADSRRQVRRQEGGAGGGRRRAAGCCRAGGSGRSRGGGQPVEAVEAEDAGIADAQTAEAAEEVAEEQAEEPPRIRTLTSPEVVSTNVPVTDSGGGHVRLRLDIAYDGTDFTGWAAQDGHRTVAGVLDEAFSTVFRTPVRLFAAGRTDSGVHATGQVAHVDVPAMRWCTPIRGNATRPADPEFLPLVRRLGRFLPEDVRVREITRAPAGFDARFSALRRHYAYRLSLAPYGVDPQLARYVTPWPHPLDVAAMNDGITRSARPARFRRVLPAPARGNDHPRPAAPGVGARGRHGDRVRHRGRVLLVDGALAGRRTARGGGGSTRTDLVRNAVGRRSNAPARSRPLRRAA